jgi:hypothetical protein
MHFRLAFEESSKRSKRRKSEKLRKTVGFPELTHATKRNLRSSGKTDAAKLFSEALETIPARGLRIRKAWGAHAKNVLAPFPPEVLSLFIEAQLTKSLNTKIRSQTKMNNCSFYPSYSVIKAAKEECYPSKDKILI